jgi:hypothetical protein
VNVRVRIERLVLADLDLPPSGRSALCDAVVAELRAILGSGDLGGLRAGGRFGVLPGPDIQAPAIEPVLLGRQIAYAACAGLRGAREPRR